jgi:uncharacterized protein (TIGR02452 family)
LNNYDTIVSPGVEFSRYGIDQGYSPMDAPVKVDCVAAAAIMFPQLTPDGQAFAFDQDRVTMINKVRTLLYVCALNQNDCVVLSAWGCGAYGGPVVEIAKIFKQVLGEFAGVFKETPFAIIHSNYNYNKFYSEFNR